MRKVRTCAVSLILVCSLAFSQVPDNPAFDVASVKRAAPPSAGGGPLGSMGGGPGTADPGRIAYRSVTLKQVLSRAYGVKPFQITAPGWLDTDRYDIIANVPPGSTKDQLKGMLQSLVVERFNITLHHESKDLPAYGLVAGSGGSKLTQSVRKGGNISTVPRNGGVRLMAIGASTSLLVKALEPHLGGLTVIDDTGLTGRYDFTLEFAGETTVQPSQDEFPFPSLSNALQQDLGLRLVKKTASFDVLVIDHVNRVPTAN
jgi:uncharacterized protein (TIGR03435 family)